MDPAFRTIFRRDYHANRMGSMASLESQYPDLYCARKQISLGQEFIPGPVCHPKGQENSIFTGRIN